MNFLVKTRHTQPQGAGHDLVTCGKAAGKLTVDLDMHLVALVKGPGLHTTSVSRADLREIEVRPAIKRVAAEKYLCGIDVADIDDVKKPVGEPGIGCDQHTSAEISGICDAEIYGIERAFLAVVHHNLGKLFEERKDYAGASAWYARALALRRATLPPEQRALQQLQRYVAQRQRDGRRYFILAFFYTPHFPFTSAKPALR